MTLKEVVVVIGTVAAVALPLWNIPLIMHIRKRRSSKDVSLLWAYGVWACLLFMLPSGLLTDDVVFKAFSISNIILFSLVVFQVARYHR